MRDKELESRILDYITKIYKATYTGKLEVNSNKGIYVLTLGVPSADIPTSISLQTDDAEEFMTYIEKELRDRDYMRIHFYRIKKVEEYHNPKKNNCNGKV